MERTIATTIISRTVAACIALGCLPAYAQNFNPPGDHTWVLNKANSGVANETSPRSATGVPDLLFGRDFLIGGKGTTTFASPSVKVGYIPLAVGPSQSSSACSTGSCTATVSYTTSSCTTQQTSYGITAATDIPVIGSLTFSKQTEYTYKACSGDNSSASTTIAKGTIPSGQKLYPIVAVGYKKATAYHSGARVYLSPAIKSSANDDNSVLWTKVRDMCLAFGWSPPNTAWTTARDIVKQTGFCYLGTSKTLGGWAYGPQPFERVATYPKVLDSATRTVGTWYASSAY